VVAEELWLPFAVPDTELVVGRWNAVRVAARRLPDGVHAEARAAGRGRAIVLDLRLRGNAAVAAATAEPVPWRLRPPERPVVAVGSPFETWIEAVGRAAAAGARDAPRRRPRCSVREFESGLRSLERLTVDLQAHAHATLDPDAASAARRFGETAQFWVYQRFEGDRTGRLRQLADVAPGVLVFAAGCAAEPWSRDVARRIVADALEGRRLPSLVRDAVALWAARADLALRIHGADAPRPAKGLGRLSALDERARAQILDRKCRLVRAAGPLTEPGILLLPPLHDFRPQDVPSDPAANAAWFRTLHAAEATWTRDPDPAAQDVRVALTRFLSAREAGVERPDLPTEETARRIEHLHDFLRATGRRPGPDTDAIRLVAESEEWHATVAAQAREAVAAHQALPVARVGGALVWGDRPLPLAPFGEWNPEPGDRLAPVETAAGLARESAEMDNCVATYAGRALAKRCLIVSGTLRFGRVTIEVVRGEGGRLEVAQARGPSNASLTATQRQRLVAWLDWARACDATARTPLLTANRRGAGRRA
jgi:hypothetical protein